MQFRSYWRMRCPIQRGTHGKEGCTGCREGTPPSQFHPLSRYAKMIETNISAFLPCNPSPLVSPPPSRIIYTSPYCNIQVVSGMRAFLSSLHEV